MRALLSVLLLTTGFLGFVYLATLWTDPDSVRESQTALAIYARVVLVKGLLPQLLLALLLRAGFERLPALSSEGAAHSALRAVLAAGLAALAIAPTLMPLDLPTLPAVKFRDAGNFIASVLEMSAAVAAALWLPDLWLARRRARA